MDKDGRTGRGPTTDSAELRRQIPCSSSGRYGQPSANANGAASRRCDTVESQAPHSPGRDATGELQAPGGGRAAPGVRRVELPGKPAFESQVNVSSAVQTGRTVRDHAGLRTAIRKTRVYRHCS